VFSAFLYYYQKASKVPREEPFERNVIQISTSDDIPLEDDEIGTSDDTPLEYNKVGTFDEIVLTTNNKEVQTVNTYTSELLM